MLPVSEDSVRDTIVAIATPAGRGGIGVIRVSGTAACALAATLVRGSSSLFVHQRARFCYLVDPETEQKLDEAVVTYFEAPHSYTGEDIVEIAAHGSPVLLDHILLRLMQAGARLAEPGEFTERAFLSGRLDLMQAEAVRDLVDAQTLLQAQVAAQQLGGSLSRRVAPLKQELIALIASLEAGIDFAEDDTPVLASSVIATTLVAITEPLLQLERSFEQGRLLTHGATLAIVGRPNAGKSSLFNRLLARERAIVTAEAGTTRDTVHEHISLGGFPIELVDTAGLRHATSEAERLGIEKSREAFADATLVMLVLSSVDPVESEDLALLRAARDRRLLVVLNKWDLLQGDRAKEAAALTEVQAHAPWAEVLAASALTGEGIEPLRDRMQAMLIGHSAVTSESPLLTNRRQHAAVKQAHTALESAHTANAAGTPHEVFLLDLYSALQSLDTLTGATTPDTVLHLIFSTFCIGK
ncbi:tRNA uridine-5-carboxymethylaminomethyl(34) synthesis GTPase MnmE [Acidipila sp. EB88]|uniref:tRNA uridine-5-carboxymethylaminomethyl(34) synthesis GTPase MnmE n=1 Tax=Acidipila sp. EB88 TaxID=2305226 RepID=UPI000F5EAB83|nr:tRNA uridine-5-carboxymethylaminomethyl(34) synthesis GTPase MnmE [Acidipila sp. EB88]RRA48354.1 tRNA uridine-5-carboxymethylaminomethyl(34) synthesis GTPase MnmE [Acidipila sp. EB88]